MPDIYSTEPKVLIFSKMNGHYVMNENPSYPMMTDHPAYAKVFTLSEANDFIGESKRAGLDIDFQVRIFRSGR